MEDVAVATVDVLVIVAEEERIDVVLVITTFESE
jgi:hypothetical protein